MTITSTHFELKKTDLTAIYKVAEIDTASEHPPSIQHTQHAEDRPSLFVFTETQGSHVRIRESGAPELVPFRLSLDPEPTWLNLPKGDFHDTTFEEKDGFSLTSGRESCVTFCFIHM